MPLPIPLQYHLCLDENNTSLPYYRTGIGAGAGAAADALEGATAASDAIGQVSRAEHFPGQTTSTVLLHLCTLQRDAAFACVENNVLHEFSSSKKGAIYHFP